MLIILHGELPGGLYYFFSCHVIKQEEVGKFEEQNEQRLVDRREQAGVIRGKHGMSGCYSVEGRAGL